jgi:DNA-binding transcriptional LysR family regulator
MDLKDLSSFVVLAEELHFGRAAIRLHISAPPLTQRIKRLEKELGVVLFERTNRRVELSPAGVALLDEARNVLDRANQIPQRVQAVAFGYEGRLRIGISGSLLYSAARGNLNAAIPSNVHASWTVMNSAEQIQAIREQRLDLGLINTPIDHDGVNVHALEQEALVVAISSIHKYAKRQSINLLLLRDETFIIGERRVGPNYHDRLISACERAGFFPKLDLQPQSMASYLGLVALGVGVTLAPRSLGRMGMTGISYLRIQEHEPMSEVSIAWNAERSPPIADSTLDAMGITK